MEYSLKFKAAAARDLYKLAKKNRELGRLIVNEQIPALLKNPLRGRLKQGDLKNIRSWDFSLRDVTYRILYDLEGPMVKIIAIGVHDVAYRKAKLRK
ncbi:MAG: type II toxin-antitoxin system RelE/ParE family toxin [Syntrophales bacterium]|nr:type II toxin-antitoxin system RelE/ParE family toxin [Syntrophales bacterium]